MVNHNICCTNPQLHCGFFQNVSVVNRIDAPASSALRVFRSEWRRKIILNFSNNTSFSPA